MPFDIMDNNSKTARCKITSMFRLWLSLVLYCKLFTINLAVLETDNLSLNFFGTITLSLVLRAPHHFHGHTMIVTSLFL